MVTRLTLKRTLLGREVAVAFGVIAALYLVRFVRFQPLQIPAYLLIVAYDFVEVAVPILTPYYPVAFPVFLYLLAVFGGAAARGLRADDETDGTWRRATGGVCLIVGSISLLFGAFVGGPLIAPADNPTPLAITGATGIILLALSWWLLGQPTGPLRKQIGEHRS
jgi:hypothetical protein